MSNLKRTLAAAAGLALLGGACNQPLSPTEPSGFRPVAASASGGAGSPVAAAAGPAAQSVPFKGGFAGRQALTPLDPPFGAVDGSATGNGTHLGRFTVAFPHTVNFATRVGVGTYTFVAADGDTLTAAFTGLAQGGPVVSIEETATVTGGTGRFAGATGSFVVQRRFDPATGLTEGTYEGAISPLGATHP